MFIINNKKVFVLVSVFLVICSLIAIFTKGLPLGIDFKGGSLTEISYKENLPTVVTVEQTASSFVGAPVLVQPTGNNGFILKTKDLSEGERSGLVAELSKLGGAMTEKSFTSIGPSVGHELTRKAITSLVLVCVAIILFIAYAFRKVAKPVSSFKYGLIAVITLIHDIIIPVGIFALFAGKFGVEVDTLFVVAILTILGLSISDTIVVFDRIRESLRLKKYYTFSETVGHSLEETYTRSINTSLTVIMVLVALAIWGPITTRLFAIMLASGMFFGTYSSIFLASPLLVYFEKWSKK